MGFIFISYSHKDKAYVHELQKALQDEGFEVWVDDRIDYGTTWPKVLQSHLDDCDAFIVVMTEDSYNSNWVQNEVTRAERKKKPFFALLLKGDTWLSFEALQYEDVRGGKLPEKKFYENLARVVPRKMKEGPDSPSEPIAPEKPSAYKNILVKLYKRVPPYFRVIGIIGFIAILFWGLSRMIPGGSGTIPTASPNPISTPTATHALVETPVPSRIADTPILATDTLVPLPLEITDPKGVTMRLVPAGNFTMGSNVEDAEKPPHAVNLDAFYIDQYEVTNARYRACVDAGACNAPQKTRSSTRLSYYGDSQFDDYPVIFVDWNMAESYCEWRGAQLPSEAQWEKAARGDDERTYPWGEGIDCNKANYSKCGNDTVKVGSYESGKSPYGIYDLAGNVWEWVDAWYDAYPGNTISDPNFGTTYRVMRGGSWGSDESGLRASNRYKDAPDYNYYVVGFRCIRLP
jgi:formylglycine-generating enzyme required for sulfatase activity